MKEYIDYLEEHKDLVKNVWETWKKSLHNPFSGDICMDKIEDSLIEVHDFSRLSQDEFPIGEKLFKGEKVPEDEVAKWKMRHWNRNPHHQEFWFDVNGILEVDLSMRVLYMVEDICDQIAMALQAEEYSLEKLKKKEFVGTLPQKVVYDALVKKAEKVFGEEGNVEISVGERGEVSESE